MAMVALAVVTALERSRASCATVARASHLVGPWPAGRVKVLHGRGFCSSDRTRWPVPRTSN